ncbi:MAG: OmpH family outer membrane protein [Treponema sp.]|nr:OmpH family outer membrane protein [Treponema sp.]MCL2181244.1 OmpH family outer membrane protein [Treponema sp.]MCL2245254.1 OmpH family outer membrane protein [Treponema sp.]
MFKKTIITALFFVFLAGIAYSQQITRFAVVDLPSVYTAFFMDSRAVREFEERSARTQSDIDRMSREIQDLRSRMADAILAENQTEILRLENLISRRQEYLREFYQTRTAELERQRAQLMQSSSFLNQVHDEIRYIAESEGYSMVLNLRDNPSILWYSPSVDITDRLIRSLQTRARRN